MGEPGIKNYPESRLLGIGDTLDTPRADGFSTMGSQQEAMPTARQLAALAALLALVPVAVFLTGRSEPVVGLSLVSVAVIAASLYGLFGPTEAHA